MYGAGASRQFLLTTFLLLGSGFFERSSNILVDPTPILSESAAAATFGLINSIGQVGGYGAVNDQFPQR